MTSEYVSLNAKKYGENKFEKVNNTSLFKKILKSLTEPMMIILTVAFVVTLGTSLGKYFKIGDRDFSGCIGVGVAIIISVGLTVIMESSSQKAFDKLSEIYSNTNVKVIRNGEYDSISQTDLVCGDIVCIESGSKLFADGILIEGKEISIDESAMTGESREVIKGKNDNIYSGTFIKNGYGKYLVTAVGKDAELGKIASQLKNESEGGPLSEKLSKLGKTVTVMGGIVSIIAFAITVIRLAYQKTLNFDSVGDAFLTSVVMIVAVVPEGLPTTVAVSLALNMTRLSRKKVLVKKLTASETAGAVSVICTDKTGTLTENKMTVDKLCVYGNCGRVEKNLSKYILLNFCINNTAEIIKNGKEIKYIGSATECALLESFENSRKESYGDLRKKYNVKDRVPFSSNIKYMSTTIEESGKEITLYKGAPEKIFAMCFNGGIVYENVKNSAQTEQCKGKRVIAFCHKQDDEFTYDGFVSISDPIRAEAFDAVLQCKNAGIDVKMLTGDNIDTAKEIAMELKIADGGEGIYTANELESLTDEQLDDIVKEVKVVARSTPLSKLRLVNSLKRRGEVVAVTGDGMNDAPAIKNADIGISMGIGGSEITKEASDVVLLDNSFNSVVTAISFGRKLFDNIRKFVTFQLTVNFSAVVLVLLYILMGFNNPFTTLQLLWINIIMDGPPALSLGFDTNDKGFMDRKPIKRNQSLITKSMTIRIALQGIICVSLCVIQKNFNILGVDRNLIDGSVFALFVTMNLFNAFNCIEIGKKSIFNSLKNNKIMLLVFIGTFLLQVLICTFGNVFVSGILPLVCWLKILLFSMLTIILSECYKFIYRTVVNKRYNNSHKKLLVA